MTPSILIFLSPLPILALAGVSVWRLNTAAARKRLVALQLQTEKFQTESPSVAEPEEIDWQEGNEALHQMRDRLGKAGYLTKQSREQLRRLRIAWLLLGAIIPAVCGYLSAGVGAAIGAAFIGCYVSFTAWLYWLRFKRSDFEREVLYQVPLVLEAIILLVESGVGILPALQATVASREQTSPGNPVTVIFGLVYRFSAHGIPFSQSLEMVADATESRVLRHVLLHLDISANEGGELVPSLRNLSDHAHSQWRLSVEHRVRRLENLVVFPVFAAVIGLMMVTAAVPLIPLLNLRDTMDRSSSIISESGNPSAQLDSIGTGNGESR